MTGKAHNRHCHRLRGVKGRRKRWWRLGRSYLITLVGMIGVALVVHQVSDFGEDIDQDFYAAAAQVIPVLFIALLFEVASLWGPAAAGHARVAEGF
jgi:hypothetical protein